MFYVGFTKNLTKGLESHNDGLVPSTRQRRPLELVYWEGCLNQADATHREKYLKSSWGKRYIKNRLRNYLTGKKGEKDRLTMMPRSRATAMQVQVATMRHLHKTDTKRRCEEVYL